MYILGCSGHSVNMNKCMWEALWDLPSIVWKCESHRTSRSITVVSRKSAHGRSTLQAYQRQRHRKGFLIGWHSLKLHIE